MTGALARRARRALGTANGLVVDSKWIVWCLQPEHMPAMIDILIAQGTLSESDRPHCVHWSAVRNAGDRSQEDIVKTVDAEDMLEKAGIRTMMAEAWEAYMQGPGVLTEWWHRLPGEPDPDSLRQLDELELDAQKSGIREWGAAIPFHDTGPITDDTP